MKRGRILRSAPATCVASCGPNRPGRRRRTKPHKLLSGQNSGDATGKKPTGWSAIAVSCSGDYWQSLNCDLGLMRKGNLTQAISATIVRIRQAKSGLRNKALQSAAQKLCQPGSLGMHTCPALARKCVSTPPRAPQTSRDCSSAAAMKPANSGCGSKGRDFSSGWNCTPTNHG